MDLYENFETMPRQSWGCVVTIGSFDGLHLGHQYLLTHTKEIARQNGFRAAVLTFFPHPAKVLAPSYSPLLLMSSERKIEALRHWGMDLVLSQRFDEQFAALSAEEFVQRVLAEKLMARKVVVGDDFSFGQNREGLAEDLVRLGKGRGMEVEIVRRRLVEGMLVSSTRIRSFILEGRVEAAALLLGRPFLVAGTVVRGLGRGRTLGYPTVNINADAEILPAHGVYSCHFWQSGQVKALYGVVNVGTRPTFGARELGVEVHVFSSLPDLTGQKVMVGFLEHIREELTFPSAEALILQIGQDVQLARTLEKRYSPNSQIHPLDGV